MQEGHHVPPKFASNSALPKNHGYVHNWRNEAEAKWRAKNQEKHQLGCRGAARLEYAERKKRGLPEDEPQRRATRPSG